MCWMLCKFVVTSIVICDREYEKGPYPNFWKKLSYVRISLESQDYEDDEYVKIITISHTDA